MSRPLLHAGHSPTSVAAIMQRYRNLAELNPGPSFDPDLTKAACTIRTRSDYTLGFKT